MTREELAHILRAAAFIAQDGDILVLGSQSILGSHEADDLPDEATGSIEADIAFFDDPDERKSDAVDGAIGEGSRFHDSFGIYAQGVSLSTAVLPTGWRERLVPFDRPDAEPSQGRCLDAHDLVVAKLVAGRAKDREFTEALVQVELISCTLLRERVAMLQTVDAVKGRVLRTINGIDERRGRNED